VSGTCLASVSPSTAPRIRPGQFGRSCGKPAEIHVEFGCVHEHVKSIEMCSHHADLLDSRGALACGDCWEAGHDCPVIGRIGSAP